MQESRFTAVGQTEQKNGRLRQKSVQSLSMEGTTDDFARERDEGTESIGHSVDRKSQESLPRVTDPNRRSVQNVHIVERMKMSDASLHDQLSPRSKFDRTFDSKFRNTSMLQSRKYNQTQLESPFKPGHSIYTNSNNKGQLLVKRKLNKHRTHEKPAFHVPLTRNVLGSIARKKGTDRSIFNTKRSSENRTPKYGNDAST